MLNSRPSSKVAFVTLVLLGAAAPSAACSDRDDVALGDERVGGPDAAPDIDAGVDVVEPNTDASAFSGQVTCKEGIPCVTALSASGGSHVCALLSDKTMRCWGGNARGQLGVASASHGDAGVAADGGASVGPHSAKPVAVPGLPNVTQVSVSGILGTTCARLEDGAVMCWGSNAQGQLGLDADVVTADEAAHPTPLRVQGLPAASRVDLAGAFACAVGARSTETDEGAGMYCWGNNSAFQLGRGELPLAVGVIGPVGLRFRRVVAGGGTKRVAFAIRDNGELLSWGGSEWTSSGYDIRRDALGRETSFSPDGDPMEIPGLEDVTKVVAGDQHACAIAKGTVHCWGANPSGAVGNSAHVDVFAPYPVTLIGAGSIREVAASSKTTCVTDDVGAAFCWGDNADGQLGGGDAELTFKPVRVTASLGARVVQIATMDRATCALLEDGTVSCWGSNAEGQLGIGVRDDLPHHEAQTVVF